MLLILLTACTHAPKPGGDASSDSGDSLPLVGDDTADTQESRDSVDTSVECGEIPPDEEGYVALYDATVVHTFAFTVSAAATASLGADPSEYVVADLVVDGTALNNVGLKMRGESSEQRWDGKPSFKVDLRAYDNCEPFASVEHLLLDNGFDDPTQAKQVISGSVMRSLGVVVPYTTFATVTVNGDLFGLYTSTEAVGDGFIGHHWGATGGVLWEGGDEADFSGRGEDAWDDVGGEGDRAAIEAVTAVVATAGEDFYAQVDALVDMSQGLTEWGALAAIGHLGAFPYATKDIYLYQPADDGRFELVPSGLDEGWDPAFGWNYAETALGLRCVYDPTCAAALQASIDAALTASEDADVEGVATSAFALSQAAVQADPRRGTTSSEVSAARSALSASIATWPALVRAQLP